MQIMDFNGLNPEALVKGGTELVGYSGSHSYEVQIFRGVRKACGMASLCGVACA